MAIHLREALEIMDDKLIPFGLKFVSYDENRNTGGEIIELNNCVKVGGSKENDIILVKQSDRSTHHYPVHTFLLMEINGAEVFV